MTEYDLGKDIAAFDRMREYLPANHMDKWVVFRDCELQGGWDTLEDAALFAIRKFGRGPYLIRQVGAPETVMIPTPFRIRSVAHADS